VRAATLWMRVVSRASARLIAGRMVVSRRASVEVFAPRNRARGSDGQNAYILLNGVALGSHECCAQRSLERQFLLRTRGCIRQRLEHLQPLTEIPDGIELSRALERALAGHLGGLAPRQAR
jgi:hypothetical protein